MMNNILEARDIVKHYADHKALDGVSIDILENCIYGLLGPNGAGKTTFIRIINRITGPDQGYITLKGKPLNDNDISTIGYLPEERGLYKKMKVSEQIIYLARLKGMSNNDATSSMKQWLEKFDISDWKSKKIEELSKGMQQKIQFISTVIHKPEIVILDEPFSGFDPVNAELIKNEIIELKNNGSTIILSTHNMNSVEEMCDEISLINRSKVMLQGNVNDIRRKYKKHLFRVVVSEDDIYSDRNIFEIVEKKPLVNGYQSIIKANRGIGNNELINDISGNFTIECFEELLPSMQEIFIEVVKS